FRRDAVDLFCNSSYKFNSSPGDDIRFETICPEVIQQFQLRLINAFGTQFFEIRMHGFTEPISRNRIKVFLCFRFMRFKYKFYNSFFTEVMYGLYIPLEESFV